MSISSVNVDIILNGGDFGIVVDSYHIIDTNVDDIIDIIEKRLESMYYDAGIQTFLRDDSSFRVNKCMPNEHTSSSLSFTVSATHGPRCVDAVSKSTAINAVIDRILELDFENAANVNFNK